jgi:hypothetical protein
MRGSGSWAWKCVPLYSVNLGVLLCAHCVHIQCLQTGRIFQRNEGQWELISLCAHPLHTTQQDLPAERGAMGAEHGRERGWAEHRA